MNKEPITAEEYLANHCIKPKIILNTGGDGFDLARLMHEYAILFAKHHVQKALKEASGKFDAYCNKHAIENAYPENLIQ